MSRYRQRLQVSIELVFDCFWAQAYVTAFDIGLNIFLETQPIVFPTNEVFSFIDAKMSCQKVVVVSTNELCLDGFWDKR